MEPLSIYCIRVKGSLDSRWSEWFDGLTISQTMDGETAITGPVIDQAELHGLLNKVRALELPLVSVVTIDTHHPNGL